MALVSAEDLELFLQRNVKLDTAEVAIRVAEGWLRSATRIAGDWPYPVPEDLFSWCIELAALAYDNPTGLSDLTVGPVARTWAVTRRAEILTAAAGRYGSSAAGPSGSFPPPTPYPSDLPLLGVWEAR